MGSALPASRFGGVPVFPSEPRARDRRLGPRLSQPRAPRGRTPEERRRPCKADSTLPGHHPLQRMKSRGFGSRGLTSPATVRPQRFSRSRRLAPRDPVRVCLNPVTLLGFRLQGVAPHRGAAPLSRPPALVPFGPAHVDRRQPARGLQSVHPPGESVPRAAENRLAADALLAFSPLRRSVPPRWSPLASRPHALAGAAMRRP